MAVVCKEQNRVFFLFFLEKHSLKLVMSKLSQNPKACHSYCTCHVPPCQQSALLFCPDPFLREKSGLCWFLPRNIITQTAISSNIYPNHVLEKENKFFLP